MAFSHWNGCSAFLEQDTPMSDKNSILKILPTGILVGDSGSPIPRIENLADFPVGSTSCSQR